MLGMENNGKKKPPIDKTYPLFDKRPNRVELHQRSDNADNDATPSESLGETLITDRRDTTSVGKKPNKATE